jgi:hypothetical protein
VKPKPPMGMVILSEACLVVLGNGRAETSVVIPG